MAPHSWRYIQSDTSIRQFRLRSGFERYSLMVSDDDFRLGRPHVLSIAEGSVVKILASAIRKLDCVNKPLAVVKASRFGLIH